MSKDKPDTKWKTDRKGEDPLDLGLEVILEKLKGEVVLNRIASREPSTQEQTSAEQTCLWIRTQIQKGELPISVVYPSFLEVIEDRRLDKNLITDVGTEIVGRLAEGNEYSQVISVAKAVLNQIDGPQKDSFRERLRQILNEQSVIGKANSPQEMKESLAIHDFLKSIQEPKKSVEQVTFDFSASVRAPSFTDRGHRFYWVLVFFLVAVCLGSGGYLWNWYTTPKGELSDRGETQITQSLTLKDDLQRDEVSNLDALMYDVKEIGERATAVPQISVPTISAATPVSIKTTLDLSGPVEPKKVAEILDGSSRSRYEGGDRADDEDLASRIDDRRYPPRERRPQDAQDGPPRNFGGVGKGIRYEIMINTSVMDRPSFSAAEVEELYVGDRVRVEERLGRWLKIRSRSGKPGYIMAQDAEKPFD